MNEMLLCGILNKDEALKPLDALLLALIGILIVFAVLIILMLIISVIGKIFDGSEKLRAAHPEWNEKIQSVKSKMAFWKKKESETPTDEPADDSKSPVYADGTCGELKLINTQERDAAMIMAIVADELDTPLNELRFKSIKQVEEEK